MVGSLCDTDFYKLTMMQVVLHKYAGAWVRYAFMWRNWDQMHLNCSLENFKQKTDEEIDKLCELRFDDEELEYLVGIPFFKPDFIEYLRLFQLNRKYIRTYIENDELKINVEGPWLNTILFEIPVLAIISQLYTSMNATAGVDWLQEGRKRLRDKVNHLKNIIHPDQRFRFADFGTRRRASHKWQEEVLRYLFSEKRFGSGHSNILRNLEKRSKNISISTLIGQFSCKNHPIKNDGY